jgi:hypothetical protein
VRTAFAEPLHPLELAIHHLEDLREFHQGLDAVVPLVLLELFVQGVITEVRIGPDEPGGLDDFEWVRGRHHDVGHQRIGIEGDGRDDLLQLLGLQGNGGCGGWLEPRKGRHASRRARPTSRHLVRLFRIPRLMVS